MNQDSSAAAVMWIVVTQSPMRVMKNIWWGKRKSGTFFGFVETDNCGGVGQGAGEGGHEFRQLSLVNPYAVLIHVESVDV